MASSREASHSTGGMSINIEETWSDSDTDYAPSTPELQKMILPKHNALNEHRANERTALLESFNRPANQEEEEFDVEVQQPMKLKNRWARWKRIPDTTLDIVQLLPNPRAWSVQTIWKEVIVRPTSLLPAVFVGLLLNMLDALSYGMILFPLNHAVFNSLGPDGISIFYISTVIAQVVYSSGGSIFRGGTGSEMIEVIPFFHKMAWTILSKIGENNPKSVVATTVVAYALSSVMTGAVFFLMGMLKLGRLTAYFPQHVLIGCVGGVGWFLVSTAMTVSTGSHGSLPWKHLFESSTAPLWLIPLGLAVLLVAIQRYIKSSFLLGGYFAAVTAIFYLVKFEAGISMTTLRHQKWVFEAMAGNNHQWYHFYTLYDFQEVNWIALMNVIPTMLALTFFSVLHVPINIPALSISTGKDNINVDREFIAHGVSNCVSGLFGSVQNYLVYANSLLFMKSGGNDRLAGLILAAATLGILMAGLAISTIEYVPVMVVGALIFLLGIELLSEALIYAFAKVTLLEYIIVVIVVISMGAWDFTMGILLGIVVTAIHSLVLISQGSVIHDTLSGDTIQSTSKKSSVLLNGLYKAQLQIRVLKLSGFLFFGTVPDIENHVRSLLEKERHDEFSEPLRYLILDMTDVTDIDFSAAQVFTRIGRAVKKHNIQYVIGGLEEGGKINRALHRVGLLKCDSDVWGFETMDEALKVCEDGLLK